MRPRQSNHQNIALLHVKLAENHSYIGKYLK